MKAIKIDVVKKEVYPVEITSDYKDIHTHLECDTFTTAQMTKEFGVTLFVDDDGLLKEPIGAFFIAGAKQAYSGHGLLIAINEKGETISYDYTDNDLKHIRRAVQFVGTETLPSPEINVVTWK